MILEKCIVCEKVMNKRDSPRKSRSKSAATRYFRRYDAITCSTRCSNIYRRIYERTRLKLINKDETKK